MSQSKRKKGQRKTYQILKLMSGKRNDADNPRCVLASLYIFPLRLLRKFLAGSVGKTTANLPIVLGSIPSEEKKNELFATFSMLKSINLYLTHPTPLNS